MRVLLVDDDPIFLAVAESVVTSIGTFAVSTTGSGSAALALLKQAPEAFGIIILDLNMPEMDGLGFLRGAAELGFTGGVIISSGETEAVLRTARMMGQMLGINVLGALKKPLTAPALLALLSESPKPARPSVMPLKSVWTTLEQFELVPYYQAQHDASSGEVVGIEALIRARTSDGQIHGPGKLFGAIRTEDELVRTTLAIADKVLDDVHSWHRSGIACRTAINVDAKVMETQDVGSTLIDSVRERGIPFDLVCLELTETALPRDMTRLMETLARLRIAGFHLSIDDYGTGSSNFELLRLCPFTEIKIDGSIVRSALSEPIARNFMHSTAAMARELAVDIVAEGVESEAQLELVKRCAIPVIQGYYFSVPVPAIDMAGPLLSRRKVKRAMRA